MVIEQARGTADPKKNRMRSAHPGKAACPAAERRSGGKTPLRDELYQMTSGPQLRFSAVATMNPETVAALPAYGGEPVSTGFYEFLQLAYELTLKRRPAVRGRRGATIIGRTIVRSTPIHSISMRP